MESTGKPKQHTNKVSRLGRLIACERAASLQCPVIPCPQPLTKKPTPYIITFKKRLAAYHNWGPRTALTADPNPPRDQVKERHHQDDRAQEHVGHLTAPRASCRVVPPFAAEVFKGAPALIQRPLNWWFGFVVWDLNPSSF